MMINPEHENFFGTVERVGSHSIQTLFAHFFGLPLWPKGTYLVEGGSAFSWKDTKVIEIARHRGSVRAGYARGVSGALAMWVIIAAIVTAVDEPAFVGDPMPLGYSVVAYGVAGLAFVLTGSL